MGGGQGCSSHRLQAPSWSWDIRPRVGAGSAEEGQGGAGDWYLWHCWDMELPEVRLWAMSREDWPISSSDPSQVHRKSRKDRRPFLCWHDEGQSFASQHIWSISNPDTVFRFQSLLLPPQIGSCVYDAWARWLLDSLLEYTA